MLGVALNRGGTEGRAADGARASWPVGKVSYLDLFPLTFGEFVSATATPQMASLLESGDFSLIDAMGERFGSLLREYLYVGGMPEAVSAYQATGDLREARRIQEELLRGYELDFSKRVDSPLMTERIREAWRSAPPQLATESDMKRFVYASIKAGYSGSRPCKGGKQRADRGRRQAFGPR